MGLWYYTLIARIRILVMMRLMLTANHIKAMTSSAVDFVQGCE